MGAVMPGKTPAPAAKPGASGNGFRLESLLRPSRHSAPEAQELLSRVMLRVAEKHADRAMRAAGERLAKAAKGKGWPDLVVPCAEWALLAQMLSERRS